MDKFQKQLFERLAAVGATEQRRGKHTVYRLPNNRNLVQPATPSDWRTSRNALRDLKRALTPQPAALVPQPTPEQPQPDYRHRPVPAPQRSRHELLIDTDRQGEVRFPRTTHHAVSALDFFTELAKHQSFWNLTPCGRVRLTEKILRASGSRTTVIGVYMVVIPGTEVGDIMEEVVNQVGQPTVMFRPKATAPAIKKRETATERIERHFQSALRNPRFPTVFCAPPDMDVKGQALVFDPNGPLLITSHKGLAALKAQAADLNEGAVWTATCDDGETKAIYFYPPRQHRAAHDFPKDEQWYDSRPIRSVIQELGANIRDFGL